MSRGKVLVVDDDPIVLEVTRERLTNAGFEVFVREDALGTSKWIYAYQPDYIVLDIMMPALSGDELALLLRKSAMTRRAAIILHSSVDGPELARLMRSTGAVGAIGKTGDEEHFIREFLRIVDRVTTAPRSQSSKKTLQSP